MSFIYNDEIRKSARITQNKGGKEKMLLHQPIMHLENRSTSCAEISTETETETGEEYAAIKASSLVKQKIKSIPY